MGSAYQFHSWRVFVVVCALPCVSAVVALTFMPESPRFYLEVRDTHARTHARTSSVAPPFSLLMVAIMTFAGIRVQGKKKESASVCHLYLNVALLNRPLVW